MAEHDSFLSLIRLLVENRVYLAVVCVIDDTHTRYTQKSNKNM